MTDIPTTNVPTALLQEMVDILQGLPHRQVNGTLQNLQQWQTMQAQSLDHAKRPSPEPGAETPGDDTQGNEAGASDAKH